MTDVTVPDIGDFDDVPIIEILVAVGDRVSAEDPLVTLESDKATMDVPAPVDGVVKQLAVQVGDRVSQGSVLMTFESADADAEAEARGGRSGSTMTAEPEADPTVPPPRRRADGADAKVTAEPAPPAPAAADSGGERDFQVVVLGSGPGGYSAAFRAADLGLKTALIERFDHLGGVCLNVGCIPSKALLHAARVIAETEEMASHGITFGKPKIDLGKLIEWKTGVVDRLTGGLVALAKQRKVEVIHGLATFTGPSSLQVDDRTVTFDNCIIAAGSEAALDPGPARRSARDQLHRRAGARTRSRAGCS